jgi:acid phosphatase type 7
MSVAKNKNNVLPHSGLQPGAVLSRRPSKNSQAHPGVSPLNPVTHRNTGFQPLPRRLGLLPYQYQLADNFPSIANNIEAQKKMVFPWVSGYKSHSISWL